jgi:hypothetical protein
MPTARTVLSPALLVAALLIGAAIAALLIGALGLGSVTRPSGSEEWWPDSAGPASSATPRMPWTFSTSTPSPADDLAAGQATIISALWTPVPTAAPPTSTPAPYRAPTSTPTGTSGQVRIGER